MPGREQEVRHGSTDAAPETGAGAAIAVLAAVIGSSSALADQVPDSLA